MCCNRDELRTRACALPPQVRVYGGRRSLLPIDADSDGTWIAVNDAGIVLTLLNANPSTPVPAAPGGRSRGTIIPGLLSCGSLEQVIAAATVIPAGCHRPFRLIGVDRHQFVELRAVDGPCGLVSRGAIATPVMFTSSGLGDDVVEAPRRQLFESMFADLRPERWCAVQDEYHGHSWPDRRHVSVDMEREDARTVSLTVVQCDHETARMDYREDPGAAVGGASERLPILSATPT
jgi:hypothetical protein